MPIIQHYKCTKCKVTTLIGDCITLPYEPSETKQVENLKKCNHQWKKANFFESLFFTKMIVTH